MDLGISGKVAVVTGAGRGVGRAVALCLAREGARVGLVSRTESELAAVALEIERGGGKAVALPADLRQPEAVSTLVERAGEAFGAVHILVNNAAPDPSNSRLAKMSEATFAGVLNDGVVAAFRITKAFLPGMETCGFGRIINIGSVVGELGGFGQIAYSTSKSALVGFTRTIALEYGHRGITANLVVLGAIDTERFRRSVARGVEPLIKLKTCVKRLGTPEEAAAVIAFLASAGAGYVTGAAFPVTGGFELNFSALPDFLRGGE